MKPERAGAAPRASVPLVWMNAALLLVALLLSPPAEVRAQPGDRPSEAASLAQASELVCEEPGACPEGVGWLVRTTAIESTRCTVFLVAEDTVATARHCVEPTRRDGGRSLEARLTVLFATTADRAAEAHEARVFRLSPAAPLSIQSASDWAVLRLETHTTRRPIEIDRSGVDDAQDVSLLVVDAHDATHGVLRVLRCRAVIGSIFAPHIDRPLTPAIAMAGCDVHAGHSGAPVIDAAGRARAVVHARDLRTFPWREPLRWPEALAGSMQEEPSAIAYATSFACVDWARPGPSPESCSLERWASSSRHPGDAAAALAESLRATNETLAVEAARELVRVLGDRDWREGWHVDIDRQGVSVDVVPRAHCLVAPLGDAVAHQRFLVVIGSSGRPEPRRETLPVETAPPCVVGVGPGLFTLRASR